VGPIALPADTWSSSKAGVSGHHQQTLAFARLQRSLRAGRKLRAVRVRTRNVPGIASRPKSRRENPVPICADHRDAARNAGSPMARDRRVENPPALSVEHRVNAGDRSGRQVRELSLSDPSLPGRSGVRIRPRPEDVIQADLSERRMFSHLGDHACCRRISECGRRSSDSR
jgi:hypothetical protein